MGTVTLVAVAAVVAVIALSAVAGARGTFALWADTASQTPAAVSAGSISASSTLAGLAVSYSSTVTEKVGSFTVTNNGTVAATYATSV